MRTKLSTVLTFAVVAAGMLLGAAQPSALAKDKVVMNGSSTVGPIAKAFAGYYMAKNDVNVTVSMTGSGNGAEALVNGNCDIANMSRMMKNNEFKKAVDSGIYPIAHVVAMDGIAVAVHPSNPVSGLTLKQIRQIYTGEITNWKELGGPDLKIVKISRDSSSGTYEVFGDIVLHEEPIRGAEYVQSNGQMRARISSTPAAIGYVGLGYLEGVKAVDVNGVKPTMKTVGSGKYPIARPLFMWTNGFPKLGSHVHGLVTLHLTPTGQEIVKGVGYVPVTQY